MAQQSIMLKIIPKICGEEETETQALNCRRHGRQSIQYLTDKNGCVISPSVYKPHSLYKQTLDSVWTVERLETHTFTLGTRQDYSHSTVLTFFSNTILKKRDD